MVVVPLFFIVRAFFFAVAVLIFTFFFAVAVLIFTFFFAVAVLIFTFFFLGCINGLRRAHEVNHSDTAVQLCNCFFYAWLQSAAKVKHRINCAEIV